MNNICFYFGTFNPIHAGHLKIAEFVKNKFNFDKVIFVPVNIPPHKDYDKNLCIHRLNMVIQAVGKNFVDDIEFEKNTPNYSYITLQQLKNKYKIEGKINFIIGYDAFSKIESWYESEKLKNSVHFIVIPRNGEQNFAHLKKRGYNFEICDMDLINISSDKIRQDIQKNKSVKGFITKEVKNYIGKHNLYK